MPRVFFTSDLHFGHAAVIGYCNRPYADVAEMDEALIENWNAVVDKDDLVWVLGDYALGDRRKGLGYLSRLAGRKVLVSGNHDKCWVGDRNGWKHIATYVEAGFEAVTPFAKTRIGDRSVLLSHFPYRGDSHGEDRYEQFRLRDEGKPLLHGHVHDAYRVDHGGINVGVDVWDYAPVGEEAIASLLGEPGASGRA